MNNKVLRSVGFSFLILSGLCGIALHILCFAFIGRVFGTFGGVVAFFTPGVSWLYAIILGFKVEAWSFTTWWFWLGGSSLACAVCGGTLNPDAV